MTDKEHVTTILQRFEQCGLLPRGKAADLVENYDHVVSEMAAEAKAAAESAASLGSFGVLSGTLTVDRSNEQPAAAATKIKKTSSPDAA